jgi:hypothetical protein
MKAAFTKLIERLTLSPAERARLAKMRGALARAEALAVLAPHERALINALNEPYRWQPDEHLTKAEGEQWGAFIASPMGVKIDVCMLNWAQQQAQAAIGAPADQIQHASGFARGCMASWQMAKTLSRLAAAQGDKSESDATTAAANLDHLTP